MDIDSFIVDVKPLDIYKDITEDVETRFDMSKFELDRAIPKGKNKKVIGLLKDALGGKIMKEFDALKAKTYSLTQQTTTMKKKKQKAQDSVS